MRNFIAEQMVELLSTTFLIVVYMAAMFTMNVKISLFVFAFIPVIVGYSLVFYKRISKGYQKADEAEGELSSDVQENITGVRVVRAFGRERDELEKFRKKNNNYANIWMKLGDMMTVFWSLGDVMSMAQVFGVVAIGVHLCVKGEITLGTYLAFVSYTRQLTAVRALGRTLSEMSKAGVSIDRLLYILGAEQEQSPARLLAANLSGDICFEHVSFAYEQKKVLRDVSFTVKGGTTLGVLGETQRQEHHCAAALAALRSRQGTITIGGVNVRIWSRANCAAAWASCCKSRSCFPERWRRTSRSPRKRQSGRN
ncbi:MAG: ABC transporter transmembrane domain-containing protein [Christensenellales bacterium]